MKLKKFNEMWDPMGSWSPKHPDNQIAKKEEPKIVTEQEIKEELKKRLKDSVYNKVGSLDDRIEQLLKIHKTWLDRVIKTDSIEEIVNSIVKYEKNLNNGTGTLSTK
jgi:hypothetical protein